MAVISQIKAKTILTSKKQETIEVLVMTDTGLKGVAAVPAGTSTGSFEATTVPPGQAVHIIEEVLSPKLAGLHVDDQRTVDLKMMELDGTDRKDHLGGNTLIGVSMAVARAGALDHNQPLYKYLSALAASKPALPLPLCVMIEGGKHGTGREPTFQEFLVGTSLDAAQKIYQAVGKKLSASTGLEGAFNPTIADQAALSLLIDTIGEVGLKVGGEVVLGIDFAASSMERPPEVSEIMKLAQSYPLGLIEDPLPEDAWHLWGQLKLELKKAGLSPLVVGDDLFVTNVARLKKGITKVVADAILVKPNQVGTITEVIKVITLARQADMKHIVSHRSGETADDFIADLAVGTAAAFLKTGAPSPDFPERWAKYRRLQEIAKELHA